MTHDGQRQRQQRPWVQSVSAAARVRRARLQTRPGGAAALRPLSHLLRLSLLALALHACWAQGDAGRPGGGAALALASSSSSSSSSSSTGVRMWPGAVTDLAASSTGALITGGEDYQQLPAIKIGVFGCRTPTLAGGCWRDDPNRLRGLWEAHVAARPLLGRYRVQLIEATLRTQPASNRTELVEATNKILAAAGGRVDFLIWPMGSTQWADSIMPELERQRIVTLAVSPLSTQYVCDPQSWRTQPGCMAPNTRRFKYASSVLNSGALYFTSWLGMARVSGARTVGVLYTRSEFYSEVAKGVRDAAQNYGMVLTYDRMVEGVNGGFARVLPERIDEAIAELAALPVDQSPDALVLVAWDCVPWIRAMRAHDYLPRALGALRCVDDDFAFGALGDDLRFISGPGQWSERLASAAYTENLDTQPWSMFPAVINGTRQALSSAAQFAEAYRALYNLSADATPNYGDAAFLACFTAIEAAVTLSNSTGRMAAQDALNSMFQSSFFGLLSFNRFNVNEMKEFLSFQRDEFGSLQIVDPFVSATRSYVYPMPHWRERVYTPALLETDVEIVFTALAAACTLLTVALCAYLYRNRHRQVLYAAGLPFYLMIGCGCIAAYASIFTWPIDNNSATCRSRIWMWSAPFYWLSAPILANSYRIARIQALVGTFKKTTFSTRHTLLITAAIMLPQLVVNIVWSAAAPLRARVETPDPLRPAHNYTTCAVDGSVGFVCLVVSLCLAFVCLGVVCVLAWRIRNVGTLFNDARPLAVSMYIFSLIALILLVLHVSLDTNSRSSQELLFALRSAGILLAYQTTIAMLFLRRILHKNQSITSELTAPFKGVRDGAGAVPNLSYRQPYTSAPGDGHIAVQHSRAADRHKNAHAHAAAGVGVVRLPGGACSSIGDATTARMGDTAVHAAVDESSGDDGDGGGPTRASNVLLSSSHASVFGGGGIASAVDADALDRDVSSSLLPLSPPRFHLPLRSEYSTWSRENLLALVDEAADTIASLHALLADDRTLRQRALRNKPVQVHARRRSDGGSLGQSPIAEEGQRTVLLHLHGRPAVVGAAPAATAAAVHPQALQIHVPPAAVPSHAQVAAGAGQRRHSVSVDSSARNPLSELGVEPPEEADASPSPSPSSPSPHEAEG